VIAQPLHGLFCLRLFIAGAAFYSRKKGAIKCWTCAAASALRLSCDREIKCELIAKGSGNSRGRLCAKLNRPPTPRLRRSKPEMHIFYVKTVFVSLNFEDVGCKLLEVFCFCVTLFKMFEKKLPKTCIQTVCSFTLTAKKAVFVG
jgi:hypothetical protein